MIVDHPREFRDAVARLPAGAWSRPTARSVLVVRPDGFRLDAEARSDNLYMAAGDVSPDVALAEHRALVAALDDSVRVVEFAGDPATPDAVFPNNVFATADRRLIVGRMRHPARRREAERQDIRSYFRDELGYEVVDLSGRDDLVAELTGPLVVDRLRGVGFCGLSGRCDRAGATAMHEAFGLRLTFLFELRPEEYHTNVVLAVLAGRAAIVHEPSFVDPEVPRAIGEVYGERVIRLSDDEKLAFVGNAIALADDEVWMSARAEAALEPDHRAALETWGFRLRSVPLGEIEKAGGSLRCCVAEIF